MVNIIKRDGTIQGFNMGKVDNVVHKAFEATLKPDEKLDVPEKFLEQLHASLNAIIQRKTNEGVLISVEDTQDVIQKELMKRNKYDVAEAFILYRKKRDEIRQNKSPLITAIQKALDGTNIQNQNANVDEESHGGRVGEAARVVTKNDALLHRMTKKARHHHEANEIYIHKIVA